MRQVHNITWCYGPRGCSTQNHMVSSQDENSDYGYKVTGPALLRMLLRGM